MTTLELQGRITENGDLELRLPAGLPAGEVTVRIVVPDDSPDKEQQPWTDAEIREMLRPRRSTFKQLVEWLDTNPPTESWGGLSDDEDAAEYIHKLRHQSGFTLDDLGEGE